MTQFVNMIQNAGKSLATHLSPLAQKHSDGTVAFVALGAIAGTAGVAIPMVLKGCALLGAGCTVMGIAGTVLYCLYQMHLRTQK